MAGCWGAAAGGGGTTGSLFGGLADSGLVAPEPPDMERVRSLGWSYSSMDMERNRGGRLMWCIGTEDTEIHKHMIVNTAKYYPHKTCKVTTHARIENNLY